MGYSPYYRLMVHQFTYLAGKIFDFYLNSSIHVALAVTSFTALTMIHLSLNIDIDLLFFVFFSTIIGYNITKHAYGLEPSGFGMNSRHSILILTLLSLIPFLFFLFTQPVPVIILSGLMGLITFFYSWPVSRRGAGLRSITGLKIFVIAFVWSAVTIVLPVLSSEPLINMNILIEFVQRFIFVIVLTLPFDIRDIRFDTWHLGTIPQIIGIKRTRVLGVILLCFVVLAEFFKIPGTANQMFILMAISIVTGRIVMQSVVKQTQYFASFWVESIPIIWCGLEIIFYF